MSSAIHFSQLRHLFPLSTFPRAQLIELALAARVFEPANGDVILDQERPPTGEQLYLLAGTVSGIASNGMAAIVEATTAAGSYPLTDGRFVSASAAADTVVLSLPFDLVDVLETWDQLAVVERRVSERHEHFYGRSIPRRWRHNFFPVLRSTPPACIEALMQAFEPTAAQERQVLTHQGESLGSFYIVDGGNVLATRESPADEGESIELAQLVEGDSFGDEALGATPFSTTTASMISDGMLLRLRRDDFLRLQAPVEQVVLDGAAAIETISNGGHWLDVRQRGEWQNAHLPGAYNLPLQEVRLNIGRLDPGCHYVCYCNSGRRASAAAHILTQLGFRASVLDRHYRYIDAA